MKIVKESPEHYFLTLLDKLKQGASGWHAIHVALSRKIRHEDMIETPSHIRGKLHRLQQQSDEALEHLAARVKDLPSATIIQFCDGTLIAMMRAGTEAEFKAIKSIAEEMKQAVGAGLCDHHDLARDLYTYQKLADQRFLAQKQIAAYEAMADANRLQSIALRRQRHEESMILIVEDDRFTASYTANLLNKDYDVVHTKTGEEAITAYIEHAPDLVLLDIHLPGLNGHETLSAIKRADPEAYVIMLSVDTVKDNIVNSVTSGAAGFLKKPFGKERLLATVLKSPFIRNPAHKRF